jgi:hypothetical protein
MIAENERAERREPAILPLLRAALASFWPRVTMDANGKGRREAGPCNFAPADNAYLQLSICLSAAEMPDSE